MYLNIDVPASINTSFKSPLSSMWLFAFFLLQNGSHMLFWAQVFLGFLLCS